MKNLRLVVAVLILILVGGGLLIHKSVDNKNALLACGFRNDGTITIGSHRLVSELATTASAQNKGLGGRPCIGPNEAMLFVFNHPDQYSFWMKDMKFPIDMVWIGADRRVVTIKKNVQPSTYPDHFVNPKSEPAQYVLELQANRTTSLKIDYGTVINF